MSFKPPTPTPPQSAVFCYGSPSQRRQAGGRHVKRRREVARSGGGESGGVVGKPGGMEQLGWRQHRLSQGQGSGNAW